jgi:hypothetical protein
MNFSFEKIFNLYNFNNIIKIKKNYYYLKKNKIYIYFKKKFVHNKIK